MPDPLKLCIHMAHQGTCLRRNVYAYLYVPKTGERFAGINQPADGVSFCNEGLCPRGQKTEDEQPSNAPYDDCVYVHAEEVALRAAGKKAHGSMMWINEPPCWQCAKSIAHAGVMELNLPIHKDLDPKCRRIMERAGVALVFHSVIR